MNDEDIRYVIDKGLEYFNPLPTEEITVYVVSLQEWLSMGNPISAFACTGGSITSDSPVIVIRDDCDQIMPFEKVVLHELSHFVDYMLLGTSSDAYDWPCRNDIAEYIRHQEGWS